jgi:hypothetical protein
MARMRNELPDRETTIRLHLTRESIGNAHHTWIFIHVAASSQFLREVDSPCISQGICNTAILKGQFAMVLPSEIRPVFVLL